MAEPTPTTHQQDVPDYVSLADLVQAADDLLAQVAERTDDDQLERVRRARQQLFAARDDEEIVTDGGTRFVDDRPWKETTNCEHPHDHDLVERDRDAVYIRYECSDCDFRTEKFRSIDIALKFLLDDDAPDDEEIVTDGGVAVDAAADDGDVWSRPFVEYNARGDRTGFKFVRCRDCGAEVLEQHTDDATHKPGCRHR